MIDTKQKVKQIKNVAVAIIKDEEGNVLLIRPDKSEVELRNSGSWVFPANIIVPGATYTETFTSDVLETTGCVVEAVSLVSSVKKISIGYHYEYVECKIVHRDNGYKNNGNGDHKWVPPSRFRTYFKKKINRDISTFLGI